MAELHNPRLSIVSELAEIRLPELAGKRVLVVSDFNTEIAVGVRAVDNWLAAHHTHRVDVSFTVSPKAEMELAHILAREAEGCETVLGVGSGTVTDLCKYVSATRNIPAIILATAPSMNGYASPTSSLASDGLKQSHATTSPAHVIALLPVLCNAPLRMVGAGLADAICRSTVLADRVIAGQLTGEPFDVSIMQPLLEAENRCLAHMDGLASRDPKAIEALMQWLWQGGLAMRAEGSSAPASQSEHMIAHALELRFPEICKPWLHGEMIAVTTLTAANLQQSLPTPSRGFEMTEREASAIDRFGTSQGDAFIHALAEKWQRCLSTEISLHGLPLLPADAIERHLATLGVPITPQKLGFSTEQYNQVVADAYVTRDRLTVLDLIAISEIPAFAGTTD